MVSGHPGPACEERPKIVRCDQKGTAGHVPEMDPGSGMTVWGESPRNHYRRDCDCTSGKYNQSDSTADKVRPMVLAPADSRIGSRGWAWQGRPFPLPSYGPVHLDPGGLAVHTPFQCELS